MKSLHRRHGTRNVNIDVANVHHPMVQYAGAMPVVSRFAIIPISTDMRPAEVRGNHHQSFYEYHSLPASWAHYE